MLYFDHVFEELGVRNWSLAMILNRSDICWSAVTFVPASLKKDSSWFHFELFQPLFGGEHWVHVLGTFHQLSV